MNLKADRRPRNHPILDLTPMVDVVFLLIIFFLVTTTFSRERTIEINLAKSNKNETVKQNPKEETILIDPEGNLFIGQKPYTEEELKTHLSNIDPSTAILLKADQKSNYKDLVKFLQMLNTTQLNKLNFITEME